MSSGSQNQPLGEGGSPGDPFAPSGFAGFTPSAEEGRCCEEKICKCLSGSLASIAISTNAIAAALTEKQDKICDNIDECIDEIIQALRDRMEGAVGSCDECKQMAANGMRGTFEYALQCAGACIEEAETVCSLSDPSSEGKPCKGCGQEPCCCIEGTCLPCPIEEKEEEGKFVAWCNRLTGTIAVTKQGEGMPPPWQQVGLTETEEAAVALAEANCREGDTELPPLVLPSGKPTGFISPACDLELYSTDSGLNEIGGANNWLEIASGNAQLATNAAELGVGGFTVGNVAEVLMGMFRGQFATPPILAKSLIPLVVNGIDCGHPAFASSIGMLSSIGHIEKAIGVSLDDFTIRWRYAANNACRSKWIDPDKAIAAYFGNSITSEQLETLWGINGFCGKGLDWYKHAARAKPTPLQLAVLRRRSLIDKTQFHTGMRELGYLEPEVRSNLFRLTEQYPTMSDIIRLMIRDADDESVTHWPESDRLFKQKYAVRLREWAEFQGIPEIVAKYQWRAHWTIPAPGQLFTFWHRLRSKPEFGTTEEQLGFIKEALIQQDILPFWHDRFLAVSFRPMFRRDVRRSFQIGAIDFDTMRDAWTQLGHSDKVADDLARFTVRLRDRSIATDRRVRIWKRFAIDRTELEKLFADDNMPADVVRKVLDQEEQDFDKSIYAQAFAKGDITRQTFINELTDIGVSNQGATKIANRVSLRIRNHQALKCYAAGAMDKGAAIAEMTADGMNTDVVMGRLDSIDREFTCGLLLRCQTGIKSRYLSGEMTKGDAIAELRNRGTVAPRAKELADEWDCEKSAIGRSVPTGKLCELLEQGSLTAVQVKGRLENIGYTNDDADLLVGNCLLAIGERRHKLEKREQKSREAEEKRVAREAARAAAASRRATDKLAAARRKAALVRKRREQQLITAAEKVHDFCKCDVFTAIGAVRKARDSVIQNYGLTIDETLMIINKAAEAMTIGDLDSYQTAVDAFAAIAAETPIPVNGNGQPA